ncbi:MAG: zinc-finger domain-containing protein [Pseudomonadota bacterium]
MSIPPPATVLVTKRRVSCDGTAGIRPGDAYRAAVLGHPRVFLEIDESGFVDCGYCDTRYILRGGPADEASGADLPSASASAAAAAAADESENGTHP